MMQVLNDATIEERITEHASSERTLSLTMDD